MTKSNDAADVEFYRSRVFLGAVVPLLRYVIDADPKLRRAFDGRTATVQISAALPDGEGIDATHLSIVEGQISVAHGAVEAPTLELAFSSRAQLNAFFLGKPALPKMVGGLRHLGLLVATVRALLAMSSLLGATEIPKDPARQKLLTRCMFYLLTTGISQLNKAGHPRIRRWSEPQPDRVYALAVNGEPDLSAYIRVKAGRTKAMRGRYTRSAPFFAMNFADAPSALGILLETDDMIASTTAGKVALQGAPEYGGELGELMFLVGSYAK